MTHREILNSIAGLVGQDASNIALRLQLAELLLAGGQAVEALAHAAIVLAARPDEAHALNLAARAAEASGDVAKAEGYRRLLMAIGAAERPAPRVEAADTPAESGATPGGVALRLVAGNRVSSKPDARSGS
jgi:hypothetical protein